MRRVSIRCVASAAAFTAQRCRVSAQARDDLTRVASRVKDETSGQALDLTEMGDSSRAALKAVQEALNRHPDGAGDTKVKGKLNTLTASLKAYQARLGNVQSEAKSIQREADALVKLLWGTAGTESSTTASATSAEGANTAAAGGDFGVDVPPLAQTLENAKVETVEAEAVRDAGSKKRDDVNAAEEEVVVEVLEPDAPTGSEATTRGADGEYDDVPVTTITQFLYERGIDFADCKDAASLRRRYADVLAGKFDKQEPPRQAQQRNAPPPPSRPTQQQQQQYNQNSTSNETGLAFDPHPGAMRKMLDPMKAVWEVKQQIAKEQGIDASSIDLWSGVMKLDDHKRLYEYGATLQANPIEVRSKGDMPTYRG